MRGRFHSLCTQTLLKGVSILDHDLLGRDWPCVLSVPPLLPVHAMCHVCPCPHPCLSLSSHKLGKSLRVQKPSPQKCISVSAPILKVGPLSPPAALAPLSSSTFSLYHHLLATRLLPQLSPCSTPSMSHLTGRSPCSPHPPPPLVAHDPQISNLNPSLLLKYSTAKLHHHSPVFLGEAGSVSSESSLSAVY